ncbi:MAG: hypothetical protein KFB95_01330 [Simkaniaceae bacterium]|nr:MAG: hypothetical protein KFB95_01330 [Simkaniaceae bacterium]
MKVMAPSSGGFRSFALPKEDPPVNLTTLAKELPSTHRLYQTVVSVRGFDSEFGFTQELSDQKFEEIMALANSAFRVTCKNPDEEQIVQYIHLHASSKVRQVLSDLVSKVEQVIEYQKYIQQEYIHVGSELQQTLDRVDRLYALTKKYSHLISRTIGGWDVLEIKFRIDTYSKKLPPPLIIRFFESAGDFLCCTSSRKKSYRHCSSYSSHSSTSFSSRDGLLDTQRRIQESRNRVWENKVDMHQRSQANYSLNLSRNLQSQRIQHNNTMRFHSHR